MSPHQRRSQFAAWMKGTGTNSTGSPSPRPKFTARRLLLAALCLLALGAGLSLWPGKVLPFGAAAAAPKEQAQASGDGLWNEADEAPLLAANLKRRIVPQKYRVLRLNREALKQLLSRAPLEFTPAAQQSKVEMSLPLPDRGFARFRIVESPIMSEQLAAQYPEIKTYRGQGLDDPTATMRFEITSQGFSAMVLSERGTFFVDPYAHDDLDHYIAYDKRDYQRTDARLGCLTSETETEQKESNAQAVDSNEVGKVTAALAASNAPYGNLLRIFDLALNGTAEYNSTLGGIDAARSTMTRTINRVNLIYERDLAIRLRLVYSRIYGDPGDDPYTDGNVDEMMKENQRTLDGEFGSGNYDIGHVFGTGSGSSGKASLGVVCVSGKKARGVTTSSTPSGDAFDVDYVAHEIGHQFGANHTFNAGIATRNAMGNYVNGCNPSTRVAGAAYEPGSGSTIMAYAGTCGAADLQPNSDDYFHVASIREILKFIGDGKCADEIATGNTQPIVNAPFSYTIPRSTPFTLTATASDPDGDLLTYAWEEFDLGPPSPPDTDADGNNRPIFRSFYPKGNPSRTFPQGSDILNNTTTFGEALPTQSRTMAFALTVRDNRSGGGSVSIQRTMVQVDASAGPLTVTSPAATPPDDPLVLTTFSTYPVTWNVASTDTLASHVRILLSADGGRTFPATLVARTPNDGSEAVIIPNLPTSQARIKVEAVGNIFFNVSPSDFVIACRVTPIRVGETVNAALSLFDCYTLVNANRLADLYSFEGWAGQQIAISLSSDAFDAYLYLLGPDSRVIARDDNGGGGTNSRIPSGSSFFTLPTTGSYLIGVSSRGDEDTGHYTLSLTQNCVFTLRPTSASFSASGGIGLVTVVRSADCGWTAMSNDSWITVTSSRGGISAGLVYYSVAPNPSPFARTGTMAIAGQTFTVVQAGTLVSELPPIIVLPPKR
jgi:hypothetical protein